MKKVWAALTGIFAVLVFLAGIFIRGLFGKKHDAVEDNLTKAREKHEEIKHDIENTPACDLVDAAPHAERLRADASGIAERAIQRFRDRYNAILSGSNGSGNHGSGGSGD